MAHTHHHHGESLKDYFTEQLLTLLVCGAFGFTAIQLYCDSENRLAGLLIKDFYPWVLGGGITIVVMVVFRMIAVWKEAGEFQANAAHAQGADCNQNHAHGLDCNHVHIPGQDDNDDDPNDHGHSHDLSWFFARMLILVFPVALFFLGLPNSSLSAEGQRKKLGKDSALGADTLTELIKDATVVDEKYEGDGLVGRTFKTKTGLTVRETPLPNGKVKLELVGGQPIGIKFNELNDAAFDPGKREYLQGKVAILEGRFKRLADKEFTLFRMKMTCCAADAVPLKVRIVVQQALSGRTDGDWVQVKGQIQFLQIPGQERYVPVLMVADITDVEPKNAPSNESES
jgi:hypothetical protein